MTIAAAAALSSGPYVGDGTTTVFDYDFAIFAETELQVILQAADGTETIQTLTTHYTVSPTGGSYPAAGTITMVTAPPVGTELVILPDITRSQERPFSSQSSITLQEVEDALDKLTALTRQLYERALRAVTVSAFSGADLDALRANINALAAIEANITTVAGAIANVNAVGGSIANVNSVAAAIANINTVATNIANVNTVAGISGNVTTVAGISADVTTVAGLAADITAIVTGGTITLTGLTVSGATSLAALTASGAANLNGGLNVDSAPYYSKEGNKIINGSFQIWQRGTGPSIGGSGTRFTADRWPQINNATSSTITVTRGDFALGTKLGVNNPKHYLRAALASWAGTATASEVCQIAHRIEDVATYAGETVTVLGWVQADVACNIGAYMRQHFGTGGSPSSNVDNTPAGGLHAVGTSPTPVAFTFTLPSVSGKTLGTALNDYLQFSFIPSAGSDYDALLGGALGHQNRTFDFWGVHIRPGTVTVDAIEQYVAPTEGEELAACQRYYHREHFNAGGAAQLKFYGGNIQSAVFNSTHSYPVAMRQAPTVSLPTTTYTNANSLVLGQQDATGFCTACTTENVGGNFYRAYTVLSSPSGDFTADAELN